MTGSRPFRIMLAFACLIGAAGMARAATLAAEVYRDDNLAVYAGIGDASGRIVNFGSVVPLIVTIDYDPTRVAIDELEDDFFTSAWPPDSGAVLVDRESRRATGPGRFSARLQALFRFQILACPDAQLTCPGDREYRLPEFSVDYRLRGEGPGETATHTSRFRPWPSTLSVIATIPLDEEGQLYPFQYYFPTGAYPEPLPGNDASANSLRFAAAGLAVLLGGIFMWPFRFRKQGRLAPKTVSRWRELLAELEQDDGVDEARLFDRMRRCLVWYCVDELDTDPYDWLSGDAYAATPEKPAARDEVENLFVEILHNPSGKGLLLRRRLAELVGHTAAP